MMEKQKIEAMVVKLHKVGKKIHLFSKKKINYKSNTRDEINPNQADDEYLLQV